MKKYVRYVSVNKYYIPIDRINQYLDKETNQKHTYTVKITPKLKEFLKQQAVKIGKSMSQWLLDKIRKFLSNTEFKDKIFLNFSCFIRFILEYQYVKINMINSLEV